MGLHTKGRHNRKCPTKGAVPKHPRVKGKLRTQAKLVRSMRWLGVNYPV